MSRAPSSLGHPGWLRWLWRLGSLWRVWLLLPIGVGAAVMGAAGAPPSRYLVQLASGVAGALLSLAIARVPRVPAWAGALAAAVGALAITAPLVVGADVEGVRRWVELGAYRVHPSMLLAPALLVFAASTVGKRPLVAHAVLVSLQAAHVIAPDAGQATALGLAAIAMSVAVDPKRNAWMTPVYAATIAFAWLRPDPLAGAPFVEDIVARAFALSPLVGALAIAALAASALCPLHCFGDGLGDGPRDVVRGDGPHAVSRATAVALTAYFVALAVVPCVGEFPVPLLGFGASPVIGAFVGLATLERGRRLRWGVPHPALPPPHRDGGDDVAGSLRDLTEPDALPARCAT